MYATKKDVRKNLNRQVISNDTRSFCTTSEPTLYYIRPVLDDIHKNRLSVDDTVQLCIGWASKKNFLYTLINYGRGNLEILNEDVIGVITSFVYFV